MFDSIVGALKFGFLISFALLFLLAAAAFAKSVLERAFSSSVVQIGKFADLKDDTKDRAPLLLARAQELGKPVRLDALYEVSVPPLTSRFGLKDDLKFLDDVKVTVQGVDLPELVKKLFAAIPDDQPLVTAAPEPAASGSAARLEWKEPSGKKYSWLLSSALPGTDAKATTEIIDQAIYAMVYHMYYDPAVVDTIPQVKFPSRRALEAYYSGQQHLGAYQRRHEPTELDEAEKELRVVYREMPNFVDGLMLLGITLLEKKNEADAIAIFDRALRNFPDTAAERAKLPNDRRKALYSALLLRAGGMRKLYRLDDDGSALVEVEKLIEVLKTEPPPAATPPPAKETVEQKAERADRLDFRKLLISAQTEKAYVLGAYLILLNEVNFIAALKPAAAPAAGAKSYRDAVELPAADATALADLAKKVADGAPDAALARADILKAYKDKAKDIYDRVGTVVTDTAALVDQLPADEASKRARDRFRSDLDNAGAYAHFRYASAVMEDDALFAAECRVALGRLEEAYAVNQNEQNILLNLGLIVGDPRCDPQGRNIEKAKQYLEDAIRLKPNDYYAHQLLATLCIRQVYVFGRELTSADVTARAVKAAEMARALRPDGTIFAVLAQAYILQYATDETKKALVEAAIAQAEKRGATPIHRNIVNLQWLVHQAAKLAENDDEKRKALRKKLDADIPTAITTATGNRTFYGRQLLRQAEALRDKLKGLDKDLATLRWPD